MASRLLNLEIANTTSQLVSQGSLVNLGNVVRKYCCKDARGIPAFSYAGGSQSVTLNQCGYYLVRFNSTFTGAEGTASLSLMANGIALPYATAIESIGTAGTEVHTVSFDTIVRVLPNAPVTLAVASTGEALTISMANLTAVKVV